MNNIFEKYQIVFTLDHHLESHQVLPYPEAVILFLDMAADGKKRVSIKGSFQWFVLV